MSIGTAWAEGAWDDTSWASGAWFSVVTGIISVNEEDDTATLIGFVTQNPEGIIFVIEEDDIGSLQGTVEIQFVIDILDLNLTIPKADEDPAEQQRILIENLTLIQQALRNLGQ